MQYNTACISTKDQMAKRSSIKESQRRKNHKTVHKLPPERGGGGGGSKCINILQKLQHREKKFISFPSLQVPPLPLIFATPTYIYMMQVRDGEST
jgi:hypothetical protein